MILGVTGGMGAGKSELSRCLVSLGAHCLEADSVAHDLLESGADRSALCRRFGADIEDREDAWPSAIKPLGNESAGQLVQKHPH